MVVWFYFVGIEVIFDVVYNYIVEGNEMGLILLLCGLDNVSYYCLVDDKCYYVNDIGIGNCLNMDYLFVLWMVMDSLCYWVEVMYVDGFRFDFCIIFGWICGKFDCDVLLFCVICQDLVLNCVKLIVEFWDIGLDGYQLGVYVVLFYEWNDKFCDQVWDFWCGEKGCVNKIVSCIVGSVMCFDYDGCFVISLVNFIIVYDGFILMDVVSYNEKYNYVNGENNVDGYSYNCSDNCGVEGLIDDVDIIVKCVQCCWNLMVILLLS